MRVTSGGDHLRNLVPGHHDSEETSQRWRFVGDSAFGLTYPVFEPQIYRTDSNVITTELTGRCMKIILLCFLTASSERQAASLQPKGWLGTTL